MANQWKKERKRKKVDVMGAKTKHYFKTGKEFKGAVHKMPNGQIHTGKTHSKTSKQVVHFKDLSARAKKVAKSWWKKRKRKNLFLT